MNFVRDFFSALFAFLVIGNAVAMSQAPDDALDRARKYPPQMVPSIETLPSIDWQLNQLEPLIKKYSTGRDSIDGKITRLDKEIDAVRGSIQKELQNLDADGQSRLVAKAMEQWLDAKIELATLESTAKLLSEKLQSDEVGKAQKLLELEMQIEVDSASTRYELAMKEYQQVQKLNEKAYTSKEQLSRAKAATELASLELKAAKTRYSIEMEKSKVDTAKQISDLRMQTKPLQAKIAALAEFLDSVAKSNEQFADIEYIRRKQNLMRRDLEMVSKELFELGRRKTELETLKKLILKHQTSNEK